MKWFVIVCLLFLSNSTFATPDSTGPHTAPEEDEWISGYPLSGLSVGDAQILERSGLPIICTIDDDRVRFEKKLRGIPFDVIANSTIPGCPRRISIHFQSALQRTLGLDVQNPRPLFILTWSHLDNNRYFSYCEYTNADSATYTWDGRVYDVRSGQVSCNLYDKFPRTAEKRGSRAR